MNIKISAGITILIFAFIMGCSGAYGKFKLQSRSESKATKRELIDNWSEYNIWFVQRTAYSPPRIVVIIFELKNDDKKILVGSNWNKVKGQEMWTEIVKENTSSDGEFTLVGDNYGPYYSTGVQEIWGPDNQFYGYIIYQQNAVSLDRVKQVDENKVRLSWRPPKPVGQK